MYKSLPAINVSTHPAFFEWHPACWLRASGPDAAAFLQGQFTNELRGLTPGNAAYGLWLSVKGKVLADSFVVRGHADDFWIGSYYSAAAVVRDRLESHIIADDVTLEDATADWRAVSVWNPRAEPRAIPGAGFVFAGRRGAERNFEWVFPRAEEAAVRAQLDGIRELTTEEVGRLRIEAAIPAVPADIGPSDLPNEGGLEAEAVSYTKGCYLGQEVMARLKSMGQVRRRLLRVSGMAAGAPAVPAALFAGGRQVGELRSVVLVGAGRIEGLAMLTLLHVQPGTELALAAEAAPCLRVVGGP